RAWTLSSVVSVSLLPFMARKRGDRQLTQRRRLLAGAVLAVLALAALAAVFSWRQDDDAEKQALNAIDARVSLASTVFDTYFRGELAVLKSVASSAAVMSGDTTAMGSYFKRIQPATGGPFSAGLGWVDLKGQVRASSSTNPARPAVNVA